MGAGLARHTGCRHTRQNGRVYGPVGALAGILARMDDMGLVERARFENDQRRMLVSVTDKGQTLARELAPQIGEDFARKLYETLDRLLVKLE